MPRTASLTLALSLASCAAFAVQFRVENYALPWPSADGTTMLVAANAPTNGWTSPTLAGIGVSFAATANDIPTPLWFGEEATGTVAYAALVVDCTAASTAWSTLLDSSSPLRLNPPAFAWQSPVFSTNGVAVAVDTATDGVIPADGEKHLVEVWFSESVALSDLFLGGHPATPAWNRSWPGRIYEAVLLESRPQGENAAALRAYLSLKWRLGLDVPVPQNSRTVLRRLGVKSDPLFSSILIMR
jgi:hypothetical protein